jgi:ATP-dependent helicase/nuclease subunit A
VLTGPSNSSNSQTEPANPGLSAVVAASAGTGKTYLLVTRIIRLLLAGTRPEGILALTFTRKAAAEMRCRLFERLSELALAPDADLLQALNTIGITPPEENLDLARGLFERVLYADQRPRITTFHAFCQELLRRFPLEADVPAGYVLLETTGITEDMAWDALCLHATQQPDGAVAQALTTLFAACGGLANSRAALLSGFLQHRSDWWAYTENQIDAAGFACERLKEKLQTKPQPLECFFSTQCRQSLKQYAGLLCQHATNTNLDHCQKIQQALDDQNDLQRGFSLIQTVFLTKEDTPRQLKASNTLEKKLGNSNLDLLLVLHRQISQLVLETLEHGRRARYLELNCAWYLAGQSLLEYYQSIKQKQRQLDFTDLEWRCYQLLHTSDQALWVQYKLDQKIDHLLLDEFQDTNPTQWQLILPLLEEIASTDSDRLRSVFLVGDTKQSIYGFRRANPRLQHTASQWLHQHLNAFIFPLDKSWRSSTAVIEFLNAVFAANDESGGLPDYELHSTHKKEIWGQVMLLPACVPAEQETPVHETLRDPLTQPRVVSRVDAHYQEGLQIAATIRTLLSEKRLIQKAGGLQPMDYGDVIILLRNRTHAKQYELALTDNEIPHIGIEKGGLLESLEIQDIATLLRVLITPFDNLGLAQVLRSPIISATDQDVQTVAIQAADNWYGKLLQLDPAGCTPALLRALRLLPRWRSLISILPVHDLLDRIYFEADIINRYQQSVPAASQDNVKANLQYLLELALHIDSGRNPSLMRFLSQLNKLRNSITEAPDSPAATQSAAKVRLMTVHGAKGLEAPVIFLADCGSTITNKDTYNAVVDWPAEQARPNLITLATRREDSPALLTRLREQATQARKREEANLLYVALSRTRNMLVISAAATNPNALTKSWYGLLKNVMEKMTPTFEDEIYSFQSGEITRDKNTKPARTATAKATTQPPPPDKLNIETLTTPSYREGLLSQHNLPVSGQTSVFQARRTGILLHKLIEQISPPHALTTVNLTETGFATLTQHETQQLITQAGEVIRHPGFAFLFNPENYTKAFKETPIAYADDHGRRHYGIIDRLVLLDNEAWIVDFKSHVDLTDDSGPLAQAQSYKPQLDFYAQGVKKIWPQRKIRKAILFVNTKELIELQ